MLVPSLIVGFQATTRDVAAVAATTTDVWPWTCNALAAVFLAVHNVVTVGRTQRSDGWTNTPDNSYFPTTALNFCVTLSFGVL
jgi:hypothetical protein